MTRLTSGRTAKYPVRDASDPPPPPTSPKLETAPNIASTTTADKASSSASLLRFRRSGRVWARLAIGRELGRNKCPVNHMVSLRSRRAPRNRTPRTPMWMVRDGVATPCNVSSGAEVPTRNSVERSSVVLGGGHDVGASPSATRVVWDETRWNTTRSVCEVLERL